MSFGIFGALVASANRGMRHPDAEATGQHAYPFSYVRRWSAATVSCGATSSGPGSPRRL